MRKPKIAVLLHGSGAKDGSEIHESVLAMLSLSLAGAEVQCVAPRGPQARVINHATQETENQSRDMLDEAARIARGNIIDLNEVQSTDFDGIVIPGGFGTAYNLCDFATKGLDMTVLPSLEKLLLNFHKERKPIGGICIAPIILAKVFGNIHPRLTLGEASEESQAASKMGADHVVATPSESVLDRNNLIVTTPAYMQGKSIDAIYPGIQSLAKDVVRLAENRLREG